MTALVIIGLVVTCVWGIVFFRHTGLLGACLAVLFAGSCFGYPFFHISAGPLPITFDRILFGVLLVLYLVCRRVGQTDRRTLDQQDLLLLAFIAVLMLSTFSHDWRAHGWQPAASLVFFYLMPLGMYGVAREMRISPRGLLGMFAAVAAFGLYLAVTAILEKSQAWSLVFPRYVVSPEHLEFLGRARGPFLNPAANGLFLCAGLFGLTMFWSRSGRLGKSLLGILALVVLVGIYCTLTRCVWLAAAVGLMIVIVAHLPRRWAIMFVAGAAVVGALGVAIGWDELKAFKRDRYVSVEEMSRSASLRPILAIIAWNMFLDRPVWGCGFGQYADVANGYLADRSTHLPLERARNYVQHNVLLGLLTETGIVGAGLFTILLALWASGAWHLWSNDATALALRQHGLLMLAMLSAYLAIAMFQDLSIVPMVNMLMLFLAGMTRGLQEALLPESSPVRGRPTGVVLSNG